MSDIMEKTIASLPSLISGNLTGNVSSTSRAFQTFIKSLGNLKSKYEEEQFIKRELTFQKQRLVQPGISSGQMREYLVRLVYCKMIGYDVSFAYIHAIKLAQQGTLFDKRAGYLVSAVFLNDTDELVMLLVNTIQKDLRSSNIACMSMALTATGSLISPEMIPALLPLVEEKLKHPREVIRKKAVLCLHSLYCKAPELLAHTRHHLKTSLCDSDPSVMWAVLHFYYQLIQEDASSYSDLVGSLVGIMEQILNRHLPSDFEYHSVPAPWLQILLLKILAKLGQNNPKNSQLMFGILSEILLRTEPSHKIGLAVIYECLETILTITPHPSLVEHAAKVVGKFLSSKSNNLRYLGIKALTLVVRIDAGYAIEHQEAVIDSMEHPDLTIRTRTLELLYHMANNQNRRVICERLIHHLSSSSDTHVKTTIISKILDLADKFIDDKTWFITTVNRAIVLGGQSSLPSGVCEKILNILPRGGSESDLNVQKYAVEAYWVVLHHDDIPDTLLQVAVWVLGEYSDQLGDLDMGKVIAQLVTVYERPSTSLTSRLWITSALLKLSSNSLHPLSVTTSHTERLRLLIQPNQVEIRQRLLELERLIDWRKEKDSEMEWKLKRPERDWSLSFLDDFVADSLEKGAAPYKPVYIRFPQTAPPSRDRNCLFAGLNFNPYESPRVSVAGPTSGILTPSAATSLYTATRRDLSLNHSDGSIPPAECSTLTSLQMSDVKRVWTKSGIAPPAAGKEIELTESVDQGDPTGLPPSPSPREEQCDASDTSAVEMDEGRQRRELAAQLFSGIKSEVLQNSMTDSSLNDGGPQSPHNTNASIDIAFHTTTDQHAPSITRLAGNQDQRQGHYPGHSLSQGHIKGHQEMGQGQKQPGPVLSKSTASITEVPGLNLGNSSQVWTRDMLVGRNVESLVKNSSGSLQGSTLSPGSSSTSSGTAQSKSMYSNVSYDMQSNHEDAVTVIGDLTLEGAQVPSMYDDFNATDYVDLEKDDVETPVMISPIYSPERHQRLQSTAMTPEGTSVDLLAAADMLSPDNEKAFPIDENILSDNTDFIRIELPKETNLAMQYGIKNLVLESESANSPETSNELNDGRFAGSAHREENKEISAALSGCREDEDGLSIDSLEHEQLDQEPEQTRKHFFTDLLPKGLKGFPHELTANVGGQNDCLTLLYQKVWLPDKLILVLTAFPSQDQASSPQPEVKIEINAKSLSEQGLQSKVRSYTSLCSYTLSCISF